MKIFPCLFVYLLVTQLSFAQNRIGLGVKAGGGWSVSEYREDANRRNVSIVYKWTPIFYGGFTANIPINKLFFFQPEALYSQRGFRYKGYSKGTRYGYISMPLLFGYKPIKELSIVAGPEFGYIVSARSHFTLDGNSNTLKFVDNRGTLDLDAGLAWHITSQLAVEGRYVYGIKPLYNKSVSSSGTDFKKDWYNKAIQFGVSYLFRKPSLAKTPNQPG